MPRKRNDNLFDADKSGPDMSPMIDLVFLLLIFFMVASTLITYKKDENVTIPIALDGQVPKLIVGRVIINVYEDGSVHDEEGGLMSLDQVTEVMRQAKDSNPNARLHLRADAKCPHQFVRDAIDASAQGGVSSVVFSTYQTKN